MLNKLKIRKNESGFTLIELLVVIAIIGVLAAIAVPLFLSQQASAIQASLKSDVRNSASQLGQQLALGDITNPEQYLVMSGSNQVVFQSVDMKTFTLCGSNPATDFTWGFNSTTGSFAAGCNGGTGGGGGGVTPDGGITVDEQLVEMAAEALFNTYAQQGADLVSSPDYSGSFEIYEYDIASPDPNITFYISVQHIYGQSYYTVSVSSNPYTNTNGEHRWYSINGTFASVGSADAVGTLMSGGNGSWMSSSKPANGGGGGGGGGYEPPTAMSLTDAYNWYVAGFNGEVGPYDAEVVPDNAHNAMSYHNKGIQDANTSGVMLSQSQFETSAYGFGYGFYPANPPNPPAPSVDMEQAYNAYSFAYNSTSEQEAVAPYQNTAYIGYAYDGWFDNSNGASMKTYEQFLSMYN